ncbi:MAG TPA: hypothetical protein VNZ49_14450 [Bacteroidia bacterium]|jgi:hypothetical protein|nr:hypothetical protein [Bacteroidia bacterium]
MDLVIKNINSKTDIKFFNELAKRLGLKTAELSLEEKEDIAIGKAIEEGLKSGFSNETSVFKTLRKIQGKK